MHVLGIFRRAAAKGKQRQAWLRTEQTKLSDLMNELQEQDRAMKST